MVLRCSFMYEDEFLRKISGASAADENVWKFVSEFDKNIFVKVSTILKPCEIFCFSMDTTMPTFCVGIGLYYLP